MPEIRATRTYLEMRSRDELQPARVDDPGVRVTLIDNCPPSLYRTLYRSVGAQYHWTDRLGWSDETIRAHLDQPAISLWVMTVEEVTAGYFELRRHPDDSVEIAYFGLMPDFIGRGLGKHLLTEAAERAWALGPSRVWLHTSTLDHPAALANYLRRGFRPFRAERYVATTD